MTQLGVTITFLKSLTALIPRLLGTTAYSLSQTLTFTLCLTLSRWVTTENHKAMKQSGMTKRMTMGSLTRMRWMCQRCKGTSTSWWRLTIIKSYPGPARRTWCPWPALKFTGMDKFNQLSSIMNNLFGLQCSTIGAELNLR